MPLMKSKSKKAFEHNIKTEMNAGKPQPQALAIAYSVKRKAPKKMAKGGEVNESELTEHRPMPEEMDRDKHEMHAPEAHMAKPRPKMQPLEQPSLRGSDVFKVRYSSGLEPAPAKREMAQDKEEQELVDQEAHLESKAMPESPKEQPPKEMDEMEPKRKGPMPESLKMKMMAEGGMLDEEIEDERHSSLAAAIMAKRRELKELMSGASDEDHAAMMAEGGMVDLEENSEEMPNSYYGDNKAALKENYDQDMWHVNDPMDSNEHGDELEDEDSHDMVSQIRRKMKHKQGM